MSDDYPAAAYGRQHGGGDFTGVGAFAEPEQVLAAYFDCRCHWRLLWRLGIFTKGGQITISAWWDLETRGAKDSKKAVVSAAVLYIFQLPARTGLRIFQHTLRLCLL